MLNEVERNLWLLFIINMDNSGTKNILEQLLKAGEIVQSLCLTDHSVRYIVFHRVLVFLATPMCYISFERVFDVD